MSTLITTQNFDAGICLDTFTYETNAKARLARNAATNQGLRTEVFQRNCFTARHIQLINHWLSTHKVSAVHTSFALATNSFIKQQNVYLIETYDNEKLRGFAVLSLPAPDMAVMNQCYFENSPGARFADSTMAASVEFGKKRGIRRLHLGYSATESLLQFKRKWSADWNGPPYREVFYASSAEMARVFRSGFHPWGGRILARQFVKTLGVSWR